MGKDAVCEQVLEVWEANHDRLGSWSRSLEGCGASSIRGRGHLSFIQVASRSTLEKTFRLISLNGDILDVVIEDGKLGLGVARTNSNGCKPFRSVKLRNDKREYCIVGARTRVN